MNSFTHFAELIPKALAHYKVTRAARAALVCNRFRQIMPTIVGEDAKEAVHPKFFRHGVLYVAVPNSIWAQRVYVNRHELLMKMNLNMEKPWVEDLRTLVE